MSKSHIRVIKSVKRSKKRCGFVRCERFDLKRCFNLKKREKNGPCYFWNVFLAFCKDLKSYYQISFPQLLRSALRQQHTLDPGHTGVCGVPLSCRWIRPTKSRLQLRGCEVPARSRITVHWQAAACASVSYTELDL